MVQAPQDRDGDDGRCRVRHPHCPIVLIKVTVSSDTCGRFVAVADRTR